MKFLSVFNDIEYEKHKRQILAKTLPANFKKWHLKNYCGWSVGHEMARHCGIPETTIDWQLKESTGLRICDIQDIYFGCPPWLQTVEWDFILNYQKKVDDPLKKRYIKRGGLRNENSYYKN